MAKVLYFDCSAGISGDKTAAALLNLSGLKSYLLKELKKLNVKNFSISVAEKMEKGIPATHFKVNTTPEHEHRHLSDINEIIDKSKITDCAKGIAKEIFLNLAKAEAKVHEMPLEEVHFHEVGAIDSIVDIVSAAILIDKIKPDEIYSSPVETGSGFVMTAHGKLSVPPPAVKELLNGIPQTKSKTIKKELTTPTGAAIIKTIAKFDKPLFSVDKTGYGCGTWVLPIPNILKVEMGKQIDKEPMTVIETQIDDMNPEFYEYVIERLLKAGAKDAWVMPIEMKKKRPGVLLHVVCSPEKTNALVKIVFSETTTLGIRINKMHRVKLDREIRKVKTKYGVISIKIGKLGDEVLNVKPEYEDCKKAAEKNKVPLKKVYWEVMKHVI